MKNEVCTKVSLHREPSKYNAIAYDMIDTNRGIVDQFNRMRGKLRISVTHACQLRCQFCHQEGIEQYWVPIHMPMGFFRHLVNAYSSIGGYYVELTGGDPLCHPRIQQLIEFASPNIKYLIVCTNGLLINRIHDQVEAGLVNEIRLSLHSTSNSSGSKVLLGDAWDFKMVKRNIDKILGSGIKIQLIYTHTRKNAKSLPSVLDLALEWAADLQIVDLICSRERNFELSLGYIGGEDAEQIVARYSTFKKTVSDRTGSMLRLYETENGATWEIKDYHYGLFHSRMCNNCAQQIRCGEGVYALRVDAFGVFRPCLLRKDLEMRIAREFCSDKHLEGVICENLGRMLERDDKRVHLCRQK